MARRSTARVSAVGAICALSALFGLAPVAAADCEGSSPYAVTLPGDGTAGSPYLVGTPQGLSAVASGTCGRDAHYRLTADLTMPAATTAGAVTSNVRRIGTAFGTFEGVLDGRGHTITGLVYRDAGTDNIGLFASLGPGAQVRDLNLAGVDVDGRYAVGGLVGSVEPYESDVLIERVTVTGTARGDSEVGGILGSIVLAMSSTATATVRDSTAGVDVALRANADREALSGGAVGSIAVNGAGTAVIDGVRASGSVTVAADGAPSDEYVGGLVGSAFLIAVDGCPRTPVRIEDSHASGAVTAAENRVGGLVGALDVAASDCPASIQRSSATGAVTGYADVGGLIGSVGATRDEASALISDVYARGDVDRVAGSANERFGGLIGRAVSDVGGSITLTRAYASSRLVHGQGAALVGDVTGPSVTTVGGVFWNTETAGVAAAGISRATGAATAALTTPRLYTTPPVDWPMTTPWRAADSTTDVWGWCASVNGGYPFLLSGYAATPCQAPAAPTGLSATAGNGRATLAFTAGAAGDAAITGYEASVDGGAWAALTGTASPLAVTGLVNGRRHAIRLRALNAVGAGAASAAVDVTPAAPAPVRIATARALPGGRVQARIEVTGPGRIRVTGTRAPSGRAKAKALCTATRTVKKAGTYTLVCAVDRRTRTALRKAPLRLRLRVAFTPKGGTAVTATQTVTLPRATRR